MMNARITRFRLRKGTKEEATAALEAIRDQIMSLPGIIQVTTVRNADREGYVIGINQSLAQADANAAKVAAIWAQFAQYMEALPETEDYEVLAHFT